MSKTKDSNLPDLDYVRELAKVFKRYELDEIEIESGDQRVLLRRADLPAPVTVAAAPAPAPAPAPVAAPAPAAVPLAKPGNVAEVELEPEGDYITSPFVGTFYRAPSPDAPPFVEVGTHVEKGQTVCVVEAMKLFNEIESEDPCVIEQILVENAQAVEFGTRLFRVRKP